MYCWLVRQAASLKSGSAYDWSWCAQIFMVTVLLTSPMAAAGPEGQEVCRLLCVATTDEAVA